MKRALFLVTVLAIAAMLMAGCSAPKAPVPASETGPTGPATSSPVETPDTGKKQTNPGTVSSPEQPDGSPAVPPTPTTPVQEPYTGTSKGTIQVLVTDAPKHDVSSVNITVSKVEVHKAGGDGTSGGWKALDVHHDEPFNLLNLQNGLTMFLADGELEAGKYTQLRMTVFEVIVSYDDVVGKRAEVPSGELKFVRPFMLPAGGSITLLVDIDAAKSVIVTGGAKKENDRVFFKPVVKLQVMQTEGPGEEEPGEGEQGEGEEGEQAPEVLTFSPEDGAAGVGVSDNLVLTFDDDMAKGTGNITIRKYSDDTLFEDIKVSSANVTISGEKVTINPSFDYDGNTGYYVLIDADALIDEDDNGYAGISDKDTWNFTTVGPAALTIIGGTLAQDNSYVDVEFSEGVYGDAGGTVPVESSDFNLVFNQNGGNATGATISTVNNTSGGALVGGESTIRVYLSTTGIPSGEEYIEVKPQDSSIYNIDGSAAIASETTGALTLNDRLAPVVLTYSPADGAVDVGVSDNLVLIFDDNMAKGTGNITIRKYSDNTKFEEIKVSSANVTISGEKVTINPSFDFDGNTGYYVLIDADALVDDSGNVYAGIISNKDTWDFTTLEQ